MKLARISEKVHRPARGRMKNRLSLAWLALACVGFLAAAGWMIAAEQPARKAAALRRRRLPQWQNRSRRQRQGSSSPCGIKPSFPSPSGLPCSPCWWSPLAGLLYAGMLVKQVKEADQGTPQMQEIAPAVREGANAYLCGPVPQDRPADRRSSPSRCSSRSTVRASRRTCRSPSAAPGPSWSARCLAGRSALSA